MTEDNLDQIEKSLGVKLPFDYRQAALEGRLKEPIHNDPQAIININIAFRNGDFGDVDWPYNLFAFGHDGSGNYYCIDVNDIDKSVIVRDHETNELFKEDVSFQSLIK